MTSISSTLPSVSTYFQTTAVNASASVPASGEASPNAASSASSSASASTNESASTENTDGTYGPNHTVQPPVADISSATSSANGSIINILA